MTIEIKNIPLREAYTFSIEKGLSEEVADIKSMEIEWDRSYTSSVRKGFMIRLIRDKNLLDEFIDGYWPTGKTEIGKKKINKVLRIAAEYESYISGDIGDYDEQLTEGGSSLEFALESHLRDFLAKNLERIEPGLKIYESEGRTGIEFPVDGGRIDILAVDKTGRIVVIELKLSQGRNKALGQLLYYMGWVDANLNSKPSRGMVIASDISDELKIAVSRAPEVSLYKYKMSFSIEPAQRQA